LILNGFLFRISDFSYLSKMTLIHQSTPGKTVLPSEVGKVSPKNSFSEKRVGSLRLVNYQMNSSVFWA